MPPSAKVLLPEISVEYFEELRDSYNLPAISEYNVLIRRLGEGILFHQKESKNRKKEISDRDNHTYHAEDLRKKLVRIKKDKAYAVQMNSVNREYEMIRRMSWINWFKTLSYEEMCAEIAYLQGRDGQNRRSVIDWFLDQFTT